MSVSKGKVEVRKLRLIDQILGSFMDHAGRFLKSGHVHLVAVG